jgi:imidazolonepropionase
MRVSDALEPSARRVRSGMPRARLDAGMVVPGRRAGKQGHVPRQRADLVITNASELLTCAAGAPDLIGRVSGGSLAVAGERILAVGTATAVGAAVDTTSARILDAGGQVVMPGFVDCHTHVIFGDSRVDEYAAKVRGADLDAVRARGAPVGIGGTVARTRTLSVDELVAATLPRLTEMLVAGTTTVESKSGYGLTVASELAMLRANRRLAELQPMDVVSTFLGAHALPDDLPRERYVALIVDEMLPQVAEERLAEFDDVWCERGYFTVEEARRILEAGLRYGLKPKLHLDQLSHTGAAALAAELRCTSVDHLNHTPPDELRLMAAAGVAAVAMPGIDFATAHQPPVDCRRILDSDMLLALATDICPGGWIPSMQLIIALACRLHRLSPAEAIRAATLGAAQAVARQDEIGSLEPGKLADILILDVSRHEELAYKIGRNAVQTVIKRGQVVVDRTGSA